MRLALIGFFLMSAWSVLGFSSEPVKVLVFSPQGTTKDLLQVRAEFSEDIVNFGDPRGPTPFTSPCLTKGNGRWIDTRNWSFDFKTAPPGGEKCVFVSKELKSLKGNILRAGESFAFDTGGPSVTGAVPGEWGGISPDQVFVLFLDAVPDIASIQARAHFVVQGLGDRIPVRLVSEKEGQAILREASSDYRASEHLAVDKGQLKIKKPLILLQAVRPFPPNVKVTLVWDRGIGSSAGARTATPQNFEFSVREKFRVQFSCEREAAEKPCLPITAMTLAFNDPVSFDLAQKVILKGPGGKIVKAFNSGQSKNSTVTSVEFKPPFEPLTSYEVILPSGFQNDLGEKPENANKFPLKIGTGDAPSLLKFAANFGIVEMSPDAALPVTLRNVEDMVPTEIRSEPFPLTGNVLRLDEASSKDIPRWLTELSSDGVTSESLFAKKPVFKSRLTKLSIKKPLGGKAFEVVGIPLSKPGFYIVEMESKKLAQTLGTYGDNPLRPFVSSSVLVTNMAVHVKASRDQAIVWVTELKTAKPVADAQVVAMNCHGRTIGTGKTDAKGLVTLKGDFNSEYSSECNSISSSYSPYNQGNYFFAAKGDDRSFTHSSWSQGIEPWRFQLGYYDSEAGAENIIAHTVLDRSLLKPKEKIQMRHVIRRGTQKGFEFVAKENLPKEVILAHSSDEQEFKVPIKWSAEAGVGDSAWQIPENARMGHWSVRWVSGGKTYFTSSFQIEQFRIPILRARVQGPEKPAVRSTSVPVTIGIEYLAGGPASDLPVNLQWQSSDREIVIEEDEYRDFAFLKGAPDLGVNRVKNQSESKDSTVGKKSVKLDSAGAVTTEIKDLPQATAPKNLRVEAEYKDPSGEMKVASRMISLWPSDHIVGVRHRGWYATKKSVNFEAVVLDLKQQPIEGAKVKIDLYKSEYYTHRKKLLGGFYSYEDFSEVKKIGELCSGKTKKNGILSCVGSSSLAGDVIGVVSHIDGQGKEVKSQSSVWVVDSDNRWWGGNEDNDRADLIPSKKYFEPGEEAEFQLRTPFEESKVLLTIEREGVFETQVVDIKGTNPVLKIKVKPEWSPNVYVSAFAIRGRVSGAQTTALLDLGKPAFRMGMTEIKVGWKAHTLKISAQTDKKTYQVREKGSVKILGLTSEGKPAAKAHAIVAIVDEGLLELKNNETWELLTKMMRSRELGVRTSTNQMQVIGKRTFGLKAVDSGGGGGGMNSGARELFDSLLLWKTVELDEKGEALIPFTANDSLTSFKVAVVATYGSDQFGTGYSTFNTTQDFMIFAGVSPVIRSRDQVFSEFTIRNVTSAPRELELLLTVDGLKEKQPMQKIRLAANESKEVSYKVHVPAEASALVYDLVVKNEKGQSVDRIKKSQAVVPVVPVRVYQATLNQLEGASTVPVEIPKGALGNEGGVKVSAGSSLLSSVAPLESYMNAYPYTCLEQKTSKAVALRDRKKWQAIVDSLSIYIDRVGLAKYFPESKQGDVGLTTYFLAIADEAGYKIPETNLKQLLGGLEEFLKGRELTEGYYPWPDTTLRKVAAMEALSRYKALEPAFLQTIVIQPELWPTVTVVDFYRLLQRETQLEKRAEWLKTTENVLRSRLQFQGTRMQFTAENRENMWWGMTSGDVTALKMVLATIPQANWKNDGPKLMVGALRRQEKGVWGLTTANAWGRLALEKFAAHFEKEKVSGEILAVLDGQSWKQAWNKSNHGERLFTWPKGAAKLQVEQKGTGKPWVTVSSFAAVPLDKPLFAGYRIARVIKPLKQKKSGEWSRGDLARVTMEIEAQSSMSWVVVEDPIPAGATILGSGLGGDSAFATSGESKGAEDWNSELSYEERTNTHYRAYYAWLSKGKIKLEYTLRLNQAGEFQIPSTRVEAMYEPDLFGELVPTKWMVK